MYVRYLLARQQWGAENTLAWVLWKCGGGPRSQIPMLLSRMIEREKIMGRIERV